MLDRLKIFEIESAYLTCGLSLPRHDTFILSFDLSQERMFVFWFNTFFLKHGVTLTHPEGGGTIVTGKDHN